MKDNPFISFASIFTDHTFTERIKQAVLNHNTPISIAISSRVHVPVMDEIYRKIYTDLTNVFGSLLTKTTVHIQNKMYDFS
jgi:uncharacterized pyridoxamine 5'-phosphate oxidase family protein